METIAETAVRRCQRKFNVRRAIRLCHKMINFVGSAVIQLSKQQKINFMPKCPNCPKQNPPTANVCIGCGHPLQVQVSPVAELRNNSPTLPPQDGYDLARHLADQINQSVAKLKSSPPPTKLNSFVAGVISIPTLGLGFLVAKFFGMLGRFVEPPKRIKLALRLVLAKVEQGYKTETEMKALFEKSRNELQTYEASEHQSRMSFVYGMATSLILCITIPLAVLHQTKVSAEKAAAMVQKEKAASVQQLKNTIAEAQKNPMKSLCIGPITAIAPIEKKTARVGQSEALQQTLEALNTTLIDQANTTHKFEVVARKGALNAVLVEQDSWVAGNAGPATAAEVFKLAGAQYLVLTTLTDFDKRNENIQFEAIGASANREAVRISCSIQIYDTTTGKLVESARFRGRDTDISRESSTTPDGATITKITDRLAADIMIRIINAIYPAKVAAKSGSQITINRGEGGGVTVGQEWSVFALGNEITDPDTGKTLGRNENAVGKIKITRVTAQITYGEVEVDNGIAIGNIARLDQAALDSAPASSPQRIKTTPVVAPAGVQKPSIGDKFKGDL